MKIVPATFELINPSNRYYGEKDLRFIEYMARISHRSEETQTQDSWKTFIQFVVKNKGDWSVAEHAYATVEFKVNRGITHELVRHRHMGFTQESTRFVNYSKDGHEPEYIPSREVKPEDFGEWIDDLVIADDVYKKWLSRGYAPQIARDHLPNALASKIGITANYRSWFQVLNARTTRETHPDCREVMIPLLRQFQERIPILFDDIVPEQKQSIAFSKPR